MIDPFWSGFAHGFKIGTLSGLVMIAVYLVINWLLRLFAVGAITILLLGASGCTINASMLWTDHTLEARPGELTRLGHEGDL